MRRLQNLALNPKIGGEITMRWQIFMAMAAAFLLLGCGQPTIDASSDESFQSSVAKVRESLPSEQRGAFDDALHLIVFSRIDFKSILTEGRAGIGKLEGEVKEAIHGKTGGQIIAEANRIRLERARK
jgi:hypothetical protein